MPLVVALVAARVLVMTANHSPEVGHVFSNLGAALRRARHEVRAVLHVSSTHLMVAAYTRECTAATQCIVQESQHLPAHACSPFKFFDNVRNAMRCDAMRCNKMKCDAIDSI